MYLCQLHPNYTLIAVILVFGAQTEHKASFAGRFKTSRLTTCHLVMLTRDDRGFQTNFSATREFDVGAFRIVVLSRIFIPWNELNKQSVINMFWTQAIALKQSIGAMKQ